jgi:hypothetical protein
MLYIVRDTHILGDNMPLPWRVGVLQGGRSMMELLQMLAAADPAATKDPSLFVVL